MLKIENLLITSFGIITVVTFLSLLIFGGLFNSINVLFTQEVSSLISPFSPNKQITVPIYKVYIYYLILFSVAIFVRFSSVFARIGSLYLLVSAALGLMLLDFPMDPRGISGSERGITHIVMTLFMTLYMSCAVLIFAFAFRQNKNLSWLSDLSFIICIVLLAAGFLTGIFAFFSLPSFVGSTQKLPIVAYLAWIFITAIAILKSDKRIKRYF